MSRVRRRKHLSGPLDWLKKLIPPMPGAKSQAMIVRESQLPAVRPPEEKKLSIFDVFKPKKEESRGLIKAPEFFGILTPAAPPPAPAKPEKKQEMIFPKVFEPAPEAPEKPIGEMFEFLKPSAKREAQQYSHPEEWPYKEPPLWMNTRWKLPTTYELAQLIHQKWDLPGIYDMALSTIGNHWWRRQVEESAHTGEPAAYDLQLVSTAEPPYNDMGNFLNIPDFVMDIYGRYGEEGIERFNVEVLQPMLERVGKAMDVFRPTPELKGWFELEPDQDMNFWLRYKEAKFRQGG